MKEENIMHSFSNFYINSLVTNVIGIYHYFGISFSELINEIICIIGKFELTSSEFISVKHVIEDVMKKYYAMMFYSYAKNKEKHLYINEQVTEKNKLTYLQIEIEKYLKSDSFEIYHILIPKINDEISNEITERLIIS